MNEPIVFTLADLFKIIVAVSGAIITVSGAIAIILRCIGKFTSPNKEQNKRIDTLEEGMEQIKERLQKGNIKFEDEEARMMEMEDAMSESTKLIINSLQALTAHALDGNNTDELRESKKKLDAYLIGKI